MKSPSAKAYDLGVLVEATFVADLKRCRHPQAEPVILTTGELVACVCIGCYQPLPADYIESQAEQAQREAYCTHRSLRSHDWHRILVCDGCGLVLPMC